MITVRKFSTEALLIDEAVRLLSEAFSASGAVMLSGGSTPYAIYARLAENPCPFNPDLALFLSDERVVPYASPQSNFGNLLPMLRALEAEPSFISVKTDLGAEVAAQRFSEVLSRQESIPLGLLGLGSDGHTAGIFSNELASGATRELACAVQRADGLDGVSVTPSLLKQVDRIILIVTGESKREIIRVLLENPESIPAGIALSGHEHVELWTDC